MNSVRTSGFLVLVLALCAATTNAQEAEPRFDYVNQDLFAAGRSLTNAIADFGNGRFENVDERLGLAIDGRYDMSTWGDFDNDGRIDTYC